MSRKILTAVFLLFAAAVVAAPQTNTFCASNLACTVSALWNFSGGLQSGGVSVLTNPVNLGTQVTGTLAGANYAAVNLASGNVNGGVSGVLPGANHPATTSNCSGVQFAQGLNAGMTPVCATPPTFVALSSKSSKSSNSSNSRYQGEAHQNSSCRRKNGLSSLRRMRQCRG